MKKDHTDNNVININYGQMGIDNNLNEFNFMEINNLIIKKI